MSQTELTQAATPSSGAVAKPAGRYRWGICLMLFFVITINYVDRQVIGVLKPVIEDDLGWSEVDYDNIVTAFQASYGVGLLLVGRWLDKVGTRKGVAWAIALWSLAACFHAGARSVWAFVLARVTLGLAESAAYPGAVKSVAEWFPRSERALGGGHPQRRGQRGRGADPDHRHQHRRSIWLAVGFPSPHCLPCRSWWWPTLPTR